MCWRSGCHQGQQRLHLEKGIKVHILLNFWQLINRLICIWTWEVEVVITVSRPNSLCPIPMKLVTPPHAPYQGPSTVHTLTVTPGTVFIIGGAPLISRGEFEQLQHAHEVVWMELADLWLWLALLSWVVEGTRHELLVARVNTLQLVSSPALPPSAPTAPNPLPPSTSCKVPTMPNPPLLSILHEASTMPSLPSPSIISPAPASSNPPSLPVSCDQVEDRHSASPTLPATVDSIPSGSWQITILLPWRNVGWPQPGAKELKYLHACQTYLIVPAMSTWKHKLLPSRHSTLLSPQLESSEPTSCSASMPPTESLQQNSDHEDSESHKQDTSVGDSTST